MIECDLKFLIAVLNWADEAQLRKALESRRRVAPDPNRRESDGGNPASEARKFNNHINIQNCGRLPSRLRGTITSI